jgi:hypothetical protein
MTSQIIRIPNASNWPIRGWKLVGKGVKGVLSMIASLPTGSQPPQGQVRTGRLNDAIVSKRGSTSAFLRILLKDFVFGSKYIELQRRTFKILNSLNGFLS